MPIADLKVVNPIGPFANLLSPEYLSFLAALLDSFQVRQPELLARRKERQKKIDTGQLPDFLPETAHIRQGNWKIAPLPDDFLDRRVEITGPVDRKMVINALNSGASVFMADFEDSHTPTWEGTLSGQQNMIDAIRGSISFTSPEGKEYKLKEKVAKLCMRPRGWHLPENGIQYKGKPISGSLYDFSLYFFHNAKALLKRNKGIYLYIPKLESYLEARLWDEIFTFAEKYVGVPHGSVRVTVLIETLLASFEMDEILYELKEHIVGMNCGRWDYIFSYIKKLRNHPDFLVPDRDSVTMEAHFLNSYSLLLIQTCHKRGAFAMGGMSAFIPVKSNPELNERALNQVRHDKEREANNGHDGTWVAHPDLVTVAKEVFDRLMPGPNHLNKQYTNLEITAKDLLQKPSGEITEQGLRDNLAIGLLYMEAWLRGIGCVPIRNRMEDAATAEISRAQIWQWVHNANGLLKDGRKVTLDLVIKLMDEEIGKIRKDIADKDWAKRKFDSARQIFIQSTEDKDFIDFLTLPAYEKIFADGTL